jgi:hypothetical protein
VIKISASVLNKEVKINKYSMEEKKEIRILLTEDSFTYVCKVGFISHKSQFGRIDIHFYKKDIIDLAKGEIVAKDLAGEFFKFALQDLGTEYIREIIKRSPIFYEISTQF